MVLYKSTDASAPTLTGEVNKLRALLKACLVDGYGSQSAAGWTEDFTGTDKAVFRAPSGNRFYLRVQDDGAGTGGAKEALLRGYETMSDVDTGTGPFPTAAQSALTSNSVVVRKSTAASSTARTWIIAADARTVYGFVLTGDVANTYLAFAFGEFYSYLPSDNYRTMIIGRNAENTGAAANDHVDRMVTSVASTVPFNFTVRSYVGTGGSVLVGKHGDAAKSGSSVTLLGIVPYPNPTDGGLYLSPVYVHDPTTAPANNVRGVLRGIWQQLHAIASFGDLDTFTGVGDLAGKTFVMLKSSPSSGIFTIETSAWPTN